MVEDLKSEVAGYSETLLRLYQNTGCFKVDRIVHVLTVMPLACLVLETFQERSSRYRKDFTSYHFAESKQTVEHTSNFVAN